MGDGDEEEDQKRENIALKQRNYAGTSQFKQKCNANRRLKGFEINRRFFFPSSNMEQTNCATLSH